ncbi:MAG: hypothetical protein AB7G93_13565 [Bdellovibrionales bacterium]
MALVCGVLIITFWIWHRSGSQPQAGSSKQVVSLSLSEGLIAQMEKDWNDLPTQAEARRETRGWRFTRVDPNSIFFRAGLRAGDLVTTEFLDRLRNSDARLVLRMEQILNRITR